jgi:hypothetical protein
MYCADEELSIEGVSELLFPALRVELSISKVTVPAAAAELVEKEDAATASKRVKKKFLIMACRPKKLDFSGEVKPFPEIFM